MRNYEATQVINPLIFYLMLLFQLSSFLQIFTALLDPERDSDYARLEFKEKDFLKSESFVSQGVRDP